MPILPTMISRSASMIQGAAPRLQVKIKGQCRRVTPALHHGQNSTSEARSTDIGPLNSWADGEPENQNCVAPGGPGAGGLGPIKGYYAYYQLRWGGWERFET